MQTGISLPTTLLMLGGTKVDLFKVCNVYIYAFIRSLFASKYEHFFISCACHIFLKFFKIKCSADVFIR